MFESLIGRVAYRVARKHALGRRPGVRMDTRQRPRILITVPHLTDDDPAVWQFIENLRVRTDDLILVRCSSILTSVPVRYVGHVDVIGREDQNWLGLPKNRVVREIWDRKPDIAMDLHFEFNLSAAYITGASPAKYRVGFFHASREPFMDLMIQTKNQGRSAFTAMENYLKKVLPGVIPFES